MSGCHLLMLMVFTSHVSLAGGLLTLIMSNLTVTEEDSFSVVTHGELPEPIMEDANDPAAIETKTVELNSYPTKTNRSLPNALPEEVDPQQAARSYLAFIIGEWFHQIWLPIILVGGLVGNSLSFVVMVQKHNRRTSICVYMAALAVSDNIIILSAWHQYLSTTVFDRYMTAIECQISAWIGYHFGPFGVYLVFTMTLDRFIAVRFPFKAPTLCTTKRAKVSMVILSVFLLSYNFPVIFTAKVFQKATCVAVATKDVMGTIYTWLSIILNSVLPFFMILTMNICIILAVRNRNKFFEQDRKDVSGGSNDSTAATGSGGKPSTSAQSQDRKSGEAQLGFMLMLVSFSLLFLILPIYIRFIILVTTDYTKDASTYAAYMLIYHISNKFYFTNNAVNFYLYCIGGSKFREDVKKILCCAGRKRAHGFESNSHSAITQNSST